MSEEQASTTQIEIGGIKFTGGKAMLVITALTSAVGGLYGGFEVYKDYMDMKGKIESYIAPDLSKIEERISLAEQQLVTTNKSVSESNDYIRDIRKDIKTDVQSIQKTVDGIEKTSRETDREIRSVTYTLDKDLNSRMKILSTETTDSVKTMEKNIDDKIQKAFDNPLSDRAK